MCVERRKEDGGTDMVSDMNECTEKYTHIKIYHIPMSVENIFLL